MNRVDKDSVTDAVNLDRGIGSEFWLPSSYLSERPNNHFYEILPDGKKVFVTSGREAIYLILNSIGISKDEKLLLPSYLCQSILDPLIKKSVKFLFYKVKENLEIDIYDIQKRIDDKTKAILIIHYFGFPQPLLELKKLGKKLTIIEDTTHSFLSFVDGRSSGSIGDISFASFRKMLPVPDGAMVCFNNKNISIPRISNQDSMHLNYKERRELGLYRRGAFINTGKKIHNKISQNHFKSSEELLQKIFIHPCKMSNDSEELLKRLNIKDIINRRRKNFLFMLEENYNGMKPLYTDLPSGICPLGFPILDDDREALKGHLIKNRIYPPIHWNLPSSISKKHYKTAWDISNKILTIPIDQRYNHLHMEYITRILNEIIKGDLV